jgi:hypothetical protein
VFKSADVPIEWEEHYVGDQIDPRTQSFLTWESLESVRRNGVGLKGPMATPIGKGHRSLNLTLRKELNLYANVRPCYSLPGYKTRYDDVDLITIRENTEGEYSGLEHQVSVFWYMMMKVSNIRSTWMICSMFFMLGGQRCGWKPQDHYSSGQFEGGWICFSLCKDSWKRESFCNTQSQHYAENRWSFPKGLH